MSIKINSRIETKMSEAIKISEKNSDYFMGFKILALAF